MPPLRSRPRLGTVPRGPYRRKGWVPPCQLPSVVPYGNRAVNTMHSTSYDSNNIATDTWETTIQYNNLHAYKIYFATHDTEPKIQHISHMGMLLIPHQDIYPPCPRDSKRSIPPHHATSTTPKPTLTTPPPPSPTHVIRQPRPEAPFFLHRPSLAHIDQPSARDHFRTSLLNLVNAAQHLVNHSVFPSPHLVTYLGAVEHYFAEPSGRIVGLEFRLPLYRPSTGSSSQQWSPVTLDRLIRHDNCIDVGAVMRDVSAAVRQLHAHGLGIGEISFRNVFVERIEVAGREARRYRLLLPFGMAMGIGEEDKEADWEVVRCFERYLANGQRAWVRRGNLWRERWWENVMDEAEKHGYSLRALQGARGGTMYWRA
ncbi:Pre-mRNA-splicing factor sap61 [Sphaceloma murrayae]|uniref:Pre-mRNA-splicing factor sap61 n=1 Tax=Sphaceloma murrayae TaxID=2082308 RepID=A0A2K1QG30_9PEZI|nr:Pre-mRNA-splicing factor sap61 [Sphaceloma murrayae]